jgi:hypothetical protein
VPVPNATTQSTTTASGVLGISGTTNFFGDIVAEVNTTLLRQAAYGQAGQRTWGEWEKLARTDPDCATALDKTVAPLRDSRLSVKPAVNDALDEEVAAKHAAFVEWCLTSCTPRWAEFSQAMARGFLTCGFSLHEKVWGDVRHATLPGQRGVGIVRFAERLLAKLAVSEVKAGRGSYAPAVPAALPARELASVVRAAAAGLPLANEILWVHGGAEAIPFLLFRPAAGVVAVYHPLHGTATAETTLTESETIVGLVAAKFGYPVAAVRPAASVADVAFDPPPERYRVCPVASKVPMVQLQKWQSAGQTRRTNGANKRGEQTGQTGQRHPPPKPQSGARQ